MPRSETSGSRPHEVIMPALGMAQDTGRIVSWLKSPGDAVKAGDALFEVETDKATMEVEAPADGYLTDVQAKAGADVPVGNVIARISETPKDNGSASAPDTTHAALQGGEDDALPEGTGVIMPALGMAQDTQIVAWHKAPGDPVAAGDILFEVETDKSTMEVEAGHDGFPRFNASLSPDGETLTLKDYVHIGIAVDTDHGLMVPVLRDVDRKGLWQIAAEIADLARRAQDRKVGPDEMGGASMTITNLGGIGGIGFTPIVNPPEVAILGITRTETVTVWNDDTPRPLPMVPLDLSYDHRVINGADAARFVTHLAGLIADPRRIMI